MDRTNEIRTLLSTMLMIPESQLTPGTSLRPLSNSLSGMRLRLGLKRLGVDDSFQGVPSTFGELENALKGVWSAKLPVDAGMIEPKVENSTQPSALSDLRIGHDIQDLSSLPDTIDFWAHEFYAGCFSPAEIAYAEVLAEPKAHFAGFWAAKEALKKCDEAFARIDFVDLTVAHDNAGRPYFLVADSPKSRLAHSLTISHSGTMASAVVLGIRG